MPTPHIHAPDRLIVALDLPTIADARKMVQDLDGVADFFKIGLALQLASGVEEFIRSLIAEKKRVFLDYKYYDVPETLRKAISRASELGVSFLTIHGSSSLMRAAAEAKGNRGLKLFCVTVLTAMDGDDIAEMGYTHHTVEQLVLFRARKALEAGCDGVIASGLEVKQIKEMSRGALAGRHAWNSRRGVPGGRSEAPHHGALRHPLRRRLPGDRQAHHRCRQSPRRIPAADCRHAGGLRRA